MPCKIPDAMVKKWFLLSFGRSMCEFIDTQDGIAQRKRLCEFGHELAFSCNVQFDKETVREHVLSKFIQPNIRNQTDLLATLTSR